MPATEATLALTASRVFDGERWLAGHAVVIAGEDIRAVVPTTELPADIRCNDLGEGTLAPGLVDIQVNGGGGVLLNNDPSAEGVISIAAAHRRLGTTSLLPTLISDDPAIQRAAAEAVSAAMAAGEAGVLGLHLEGPFLEPARCGAHRAELIRPIEAGDIEWLCDLDIRPLVLTLAPEHVAPEQLRQLADAGVLLCAGHTNADRDTVVEAIAAGLRGFTHLFNAMSPLTAREPGVVGAALDDPNTWAGIIADGHHVHPAAIRLAHRLKGAGKLLLVSDAMATVGSSDTGFALYGERIETAGGRLVNAAGRLAGSAIALIDAVRTAHQVVGLELGECLRMASLYPANFLNLGHRLGRLQPGYRADMLFFDEDFTVEGAWLAGVKS